MQLQSRDERYREHAHHRFEDPALVQFADRYRLGKELDRGAFGTVFEATDLQDGSLVAVKCLSMPSALHRAAVREETEVMRTFPDDHPALVNMINLFEQPTQVHIVMEYLAGGNLFTHLCTYFSPLDSGDEYGEIHTHAVFSQLVAGLDALHALQVVHRDLKPENILLANHAASGDAVVRIADFGLALRLSRCPDGVTSEYKGTPMYMSPQVLRLEPYAYDVDLWALGVLLFQLLSGEYPFEAGDDDDKRRTRILAADWQLCHPNWAAVSPDAKDLVAKLLVAKASRRATMEHVLAHPWMLNGDAMAAAHEQAVGGSTCSCDAPPMTPPPLSRGPSRASPPRSLSRQRSSLGAQSVLASSPLTSGAKSVVGEARTSLLTPALRGTMETLRVRASQMEAERRQHRRDEWGAAPPHAASTTAAQGQQALNLL